MDGTNKEQHNPRQHPSRQLFPPRAMCLLRVREGESMQTSQLSVGEEIADEFSKSSVRFPLGRVGDGCAAAVLVVLILACLFHRWFWVKRRFFGHGCCKCSHLKGSCWRHWLGRVEGYVLQGWWSWEIGFVGTREVGKAPDVS
jgi:hypothetical protein